MTGRERFAAMVAVLSTAALLGTHAATAQERQEGEQWVDITTWDTENLYKGWSAEELLDEEVYGETGEVIGEVEDFIVGPDGNILTVVIEGGGFLDIGDSHVAVPWDQVRRVGTASITVPLTDDNLDQYGLFAGVDDVTTQPQNWRLRNLIGDYLTLEGGGGYGYVQDVIFSQDGKIEAVVAEPAYGYGYGRAPLAFPYYGAGYDPYQAYYATPYTQAQLKDVSPFNYGRLE